MSQNVSALYITGGQQKPRAADEWKAYAKAVILRVETTTSTVSQVVTYTSPAEVCPEQEPSILFKAASHVGNRLYVCTNTEVLVFETPTFRQTGYLSSKRFNDVHHVCPSPDGNLFVISTGLDTLLEINIRGEVLNEWPVIEGDEPRRFSVDIDYRKVPTTKPHAAHPNHIMHDGERCWVSRFHQKDVICIDDRTRRVQFSGGPHDGVLHNGFAYFTTVNGKIYVVNTRRATIEMCIDLNGIAHHDSDLGWMRGILPVNERHCWVGFSRLRPTKLRDTLNCFRHGFRRYQLPTRLALYDFVSRELLQEIDVEPFGMNAVYSILPERAAPASDVLCSPKLSSSSERVRDVQMLQ